MHNEGATTYRINPSRPLSSATSPGREPKLFSNTTTCERRTLILFPTAVDPLKSGSSEDNSEKVVVGELRDLHMRPGWPQERL